MSPSVNDNEWLGDGVYFWENDYDHALQWAKEHVKAGETPDVIGAIINPGNCFDLTTTTWLRILEASVAPFLLQVKRDGRKLLPNVAKRHSYDCALMNYAREKWALYASEKNREINTVRGAFYEGEQIGNSSFGSLNHIQWAVVTPEKSILGYFRPTEAMRKSGLLTP